MKTSERILAEAASSFGSKGYEATSLDGLAKELGFTKQTILYHFGSKDDLLAAVIDDSVDKLAEALDSAVGGSTDGGSTGGLSTDEVAPGEVEQSETAIGGAVEGGAAKSGTAIEGAATGEKATKGTEQSKNISSPTANDSNSNGIEAVEAIVKAVFRLAIQRPEVLGILREVTRLGEPWSHQVRNKLEPLVKRAEDFLEVEMAAGRIRECNVRLLLISTYSTVMGVATEIEVLRAMGVEPTLKETVIRRRELLKFLSSALQ